MNEWSVNVLGKLVILSVWWNNSYKIYKFKLIEVKGEIMVNIVYFY